MPLRTLRLALTALLLGVLGACGGSSDATTEEPPYTLTDVAPLEGTTAGGTRVTITGTGFRLLEPLIGGVRFGEGFAQDVEVLSDTTILCTSPPGVVGSVAVVIEGREQAQILLTGGFRYVAALLLVADGAAADTPSLWQVDLDAARAELIGPMGLGVTCLARAPDGLVFGIEEGAPHRLLQLDTVLGAAVPVALVTEAGSGDPLQLADMTFVGPRLLARTVAGVVGEVDRVLGTVTPLAAQPPVGTGFGVAGSTDGRLHLAPLVSRDPLLLWDPVGGSLSPGPSLDYGAPARLTTLALNQGRLYAVDVDPAGLVPPALVRIHPTLGWSEVALVLPPGVRAVAHLR